MATSTPTIIDGNLVINGAIVAPASDVAGWAKESEPQNGKTWRVTMRDGTSKNCKVVPDGSLKDVYTKAEVDAKIEAVSGQTLSGVTFDEETGEIVIEQE